MALQKPDILQTKNTETQKTKTDSSVVSKPNILATNTNRSSASVADITARNYKLSQERADEQDKMLVESESRRRDNTVSPTTTRTAEQMALNPNAIMGNGVNATREKAKQQSNMISGEKESFGETLRDTALSGLSGVGSAYSGFGGYFNELSAKAGQLLGKLVGNEEYGNEWYQESNQIAQDYYDKAEELGQYSAEKSNAAKQGRTGFGRLAVDVGSQGVQMATDAAAALATGGNTLIPLAARSFGGAAYESKDSGASLGKRGLYAAGTAGVEVLTEKMFDGLAGVYGAGMADEIVEETINKMAKTEAGRAALKVVASFAEEGLEEGISGVVNPALQTLYNGNTLGQNYDALQASDVLYDMLVGGIMGGLGGVVEVSRDAVNTQNSNVGKSTDTTQNNSENALRNAAVQMQQETENQQRAEAESEKVNATSQARYYEDSVKSMTGENGGRAFVASYDGKTDMIEYLNGFIDYYNAGASGQKMSSVKVMTNLTSNQQAIAYNAGKIDARNNLVSAKANIKTVNPNAGLSSDEMTVKNTASWNAETKNAVNDVGKKFGMKVIVDDTITDDVTGKGGNGYYDYDTNELHISAKAKNPVMVVVRHELTHRMQTLSPKEYTRFRNYAVKIVGEQAVRDKQMKYGNISSERAMDEVAAEYAETLLTDSNAIYDFINNDRTAAQKFYDALKEIIQSIKEFFGKDVSAEQAERLWKDAFEKSKKESKKAQKNANNTSSTESLRIVPISEQEKAERNISFSLITDDKTLDMLENQKTVKVYRAMQIIDGKLYPPMAARIKDESGKKQMVESAEIGKWYQSDERPDLVKNGKFELDKANGSTVPAAYNPYFHTSLSPLNDQFSSAWKRENLVTVEGEVPVSELNSGYKAEGAKDSVGEVKWHSGPVSSKLAHIGNPRRVILTRYFKIDRIVPDKEVANKIASMLKGTDISIPQNVITPSLKSELENNGVKIESNKMFSLIDPVEETKTLVALHNLTEEKLLGDLELGGFPMPSIAVTKASIPHTNFGDITLVMDKSSIDPKANKKNKVYSADAWTPTFPNIDYEPNKDVQKKINKLYYGMAKERGYDFMIPFYNYVNDIERELSRTKGTEGIIKELKDDSDMKNIYLAASGKEPVELKDIRIVNRMDEDKIKQNEYFVNAIGEDELKKLYPEDKKSAFETKVKWIKERGDELDSIAREYFKSFGIDGEQLDNVMEVYTPGAILSEFVIPARNYLKNGAETVETKKDYDLQKSEINKAVNQKDYEEWLHGLFDGIVKRTGVYNNKPYYTDNGDTRSFSQTHYDVTLQNIVKAMAGQNNVSTKNVAGFHGVKTLRAATAEEFKSIADMHNREGRLQHLTEDEASKIADNLSDRMYQVMKDIYDTKEHGKYDNSFIEMDSIGEILCEVAELSNKSNENIKEVFSKYRYTITDDMAHDIMQVLFDISEMPVNIFEAKPARAVGFNEVLAAVLPDTASDNIKERLEDVGVKIVTYKEGDDSDRIEKVNSVKNAKFSLMDDSKEATIAKQQEMIDYLKSQLKRSTSVKTNKADIAKIARDTAKAWDSKYDNGSTIARLQSLYDFIANGKDKQGNELSWELVWDEAKSIAKDILSESVTRNDDMYQQYSDLRKLVKDTKLYVSRETMSAEEYADLKSVIGSRMTLSRTEGTAIDDFYKTLSDNYQEFFDESKVSNPADQLHHIAEVLNDLRPVYENRFENDTTASDYLADELINAFYDARQEAPTFADKAAYAKQEAVANVKNKDREKYSAKEKKLREQYNERINKMREMNKEKLQKKMDDARDDRDKKISALKEKYKVKDTNRREKLSARKMREKITRHAKDLSDKLLKPTDKKHIPQELKEPVAELLKSINLESAGGKETKRTERWRNLRDAYDKIVGDNYDTSDIVVDPDLLGSDGIFQSIIEIGDKPIAEMNTDELSLIWKALRGIEGSISSINKAFALGRFQEISEIAEKLKVDNIEKKDRKTLKGFAGGIQKNLTIDNLTPQAFFHRLGSTGDYIFRMMRKAQDKQIMMTKDAEKYTNAVVSDMDINKLEKEMHTVSLGGQDVELSTAQIMELYALTKREQAMNHIVNGGGIHPDHVDTSKGIWVVDKAEPIRGVDLDQIAKIVSMLTKEQKDIVDALQSYMSTEVSAWGNKASMEVYNYEKFLEDIYWPIRTSETETKKDVKEFQAVPSMPNKGFAMQTNEHAKTSIRLGSVFDTYSRHVSDMANYAAWLAVSEDLKRIDNYKFIMEGNTTGTVSGVIDRAIGIGANNYFMKLMTDIARGVKSEPILTGKITGNYKAAAVGANIRVIVQQPTAILRAFSMIAPKYFVNTDKAMSGWNKALKYAPIAVWKDWGYFDISTGRSMKNILFNSDSKIEKTKNKLMEGASWADSVAWGALWNACERETRATTDLTVGSMEYYNHVSERFSEIVDSTQVVDGILQRSGNMRSADNLVKMSTSFMGEPTKQYNMLMSAIYDFNNALGKDAKEKAANALKATSLSLLVSGIANAAAQSFVDAMRSDDKDDYWDKWLDEFLENIIDTFNPFSYMPVIKDIFSALTGTSIKRMDMETWYKLGTAASTLTKALQGEGGSQTLANATANFSLEVARLVGLPIANLKRDVLAIVTTAAYETHNYVFMYKMEKTMRKIGYDSNRHYFYDILYAAKKNGDMKAYNEIKRDMMKNGFEESAINRNMTNRADKETE